MTDREMAIAIAEQLIKAEFRIGALEIEMDAPRSGLWRKNVEQALRADPIAREFHARLDEVRSVLGVASPEGLLHILHQVLTQ